MYYSNNLKLIKLLIVKSNENEFFKKITSKIKFAPFV